MNLIYIDFPCVFKLREIADKIMEDAQKTVEVLQLDRQRPTAAGGPIIALSCTVNVLHMDHQRPSAVGGR